MYSNEHIKYLKNIKKNSILIHTFQILIFIFFILIWQILANLNLINTFLTSSPTKVISTLTNLYITNNLFPHIYTTIYETLISFILGTLLGLMISTLLWWFKNLRRIVEPYLTIINSLPKVALGPIIIIWGGASTKSVIIMALLISTIITIISVNQEFNNVDSNKIKLMKSFNAKKSQIFSKLIFPSSLNTIINSMKIHMSMSLVGVIMGEFLVSKQGIGYLILYGSQVFNLNLVITGIFLLSIISAILYYLIDFTLKRLNI